jgi:hypothetical protein
MWWLVDNANAIWLLLALVALGLGIAAYQTGRTKFLLWLGGVLVIGLLFWLLCHFVVTDKKQVRINIHEMAQATLDHDANKLQGYLAPDFVFQGLKRKEAAESVTQRAAAAKVTDFHIWDFEINELSRSTGKAKVSFGLTVHLAGGETRMLRCRANFVFANGRWLLQSFQVYNPVANTEEPIHVPL